MPLTIKNHYSSKPFRVKTKRGFFQKQSTDKVILEVGLFLCIGCISSIGQRFENDGIFEMSENHDFIKLLRWSYMPCQVIRSLDQIIILDQVELETLKVYIKNSPAKGFISLSESSIRALIFFN